MAATKTTALETMDIELTHRDQDTPQKSGTVVDDDEMHRMGKVQEFKVRRPWRRTVQHGHSHVSLEKYATPGSIKFRIGLASDMGISYHVSIYCFLFQSSRSDRSVTCNSPIQFGLHWFGRWWPSRHVLVIYLDFYWIRIHHRLPGGNGINGAH